MRLLIDYHGGDLDESLRPYAYWAPNGKETQDRISREMVLAFGLDHIIIWRDRPTDLGATRYLDNTSTARGKPSIVVEAGYAGVVEADEVALLVDGTVSTMRALKMLSGDSRPIENPVWLDRVTDATKVQDRRGLFGLDKQQLADTILMPGLKLKAKGTTDDQGRIVAKTIMTDGDDIETAEMIEAGLHPTPGGTMDQNGNLSGTPTATGTFLFTVQVQDSVGAAAMANFTITVQ